jgi:hypothetical protein
MLTRTLRYTLWIASTLGLAGFVLLAGRGLLGTQSVDPLDAAILQQAVRITEHRPPLVDPAENPGVALMPGSPIVVAALVDVFDVRPWEPGLVGLLSILLAAALTAVVVARETENVTLGVTGATFLLMGQGLTEGAAVANCPQSLLLFLVLAGYIVLRYTRGITATLLASCALAAACFTHPAGLWFAFAALIHLGLHDRRRCVAYALALGALVGGGQIALTLRLGEGFNLHAWQIPFLLMRFQPVNLLTLLGGQLLGTLGVLTLASVLAFAMPVRPWQGAVGLWTWMGFAALGAAMLTTQSLLPAPEALPPVVVALAIVGPISIHRLVIHLSAWPGSSRTAGQKVVLTAIALQFVMLLAHLVPSLSATAI